MRIVIAGANGFIGRYLADYFARQSHDLTLLARRKFETPYTVSLWDPDHGLIDTDALKGQDVVINLAGRSLADGRWTKEHKREIIASRLSSTGLIAKTIAGFTNKSSLLINSSGSNYYGSHPGNVTITESDPPGTTFLSEVCLKWEQATLAADAAGIRVVKTRSGIVLGKGGGALEKIAQPFKMGLGGKIGNGRQMMSWVALDDLGPIYDHIISTASLAGGVNVCAPNPVTNEEFTHDMGRALHRSTLLTVPSFALKLALGEMADEMLLGGAAVMPKKLLDSGYQFRYPELLPLLKEIVD